MSRLILIDGSHTEEMRLVVTNKGIVEELEYQGATKKLIKDNIYLAKVDKVEPSLQAAFIDYGGDRHGFLPFSEIHPRYYQIPVADKEALLELIQKQKKDSLEEDVEKLGDDEKSEVSESSYLDRREKMLPDFHKKYKIHEVIKKDQVLLVQVTKEERGHKGVSLTTYISLAGRYCVFMPNSKSDGVSKRIDDSAERERLKLLSKELLKDDNEGALILRTAAAHKTKTEIKRDFSYLNRIWQSICDNTISSKAPAFIYEESDIVRKCIRDLYDSEIDEVIVSGAAAYQNAYDFMKLVLPRHTDKIRLYNDVMPIFARYNVEEQISALYQSSVYLESGGSLVINQTEALIAIDINSGRYTDEHNVENTALKTNLEAVPEIVRQIKLRDLSGLIVIDFIDMELVHNRKKVEKAFKDAFVNDRARVQFSRISEFGLLEMSRQRLRQNFIESNFLSCSACDGRGRVRSMTLTAVAILRAIEKEIAFDKECEEIRVGVSSACAIYLFNNKAQDVQELQRISNKRIEFFIDEAAGMDGFFIEKSRFTSQKKIPTPLSAIGTEPYREEKTSDNVNLEEVDSNTANKKPHAHQHKYKKRYKKHINQNPNQKQRFDPPAQQPQKGEDKKGLLKTIWKKFTD